MSDPQKEWRDRNPHHVKEMRRTRAQRHRERMKKVVHEIKSQPCADCGQRFDPVCMDFDHRDPSTKIANVSHLVFRSVVQLIAEIKKCDVVCANCHRIRTFRKRNHAETSHRVMPESTQLNIAIGEPQTPLISGHETPTGGDYLGCSICGATFSCDCAAKVSPSNWACPTCDAPAGRPCWTTPLAGNSCTLRYHGARLHMAHLRADELRAINAGLRELRDTPPDLNSASMWRAEVDGKFDDGGES